MLGGTGSITGAVLVAVVLSVLTQLLRPVEEAANAFGASQMIVAFVVLIVLITRPKGLFGTAEPDLVGWLLRRFGSRKQHEAFSNREGNCNAEYHEKTGHRGRRESLREFRSAGAGAGHQCRGALQRLQRRASPRWTFPRCTGFS